MEHDMNCTYLDTELGLVKITGNQEAITHIDFVSAKNQDENPTPVLTLSLIHI